MSCFKFCRSPVSFFLVLFFLGDCLSAQVRHVVMVEEFTGMWCGDCPRGQTACDHLNEKFGSSVLCIGMHSGDSLSNSYSNGIVNQCNVTEFPLAFVDRTSFHAQGGVFQEIGSPTDLDNIVSQQLATEPRVSVTVRNSYDPNTRVLSATVQAHFLQSSPENFRINCLLLEDSISTNDRQANFMDNDISSTWYHAGNPVRVYYQRNTARVNLSGSIWGEELEKNAANSYSQTYTYVLPSTWNERQIKLVGFVTGWGSPGSALDTSRFNILNASVTGLSEAVVPVNEFSGFTSPDLFPNPFAVQTTIPVNIGNESIRVALDVYTPIGLKVCRLAEETLASGDHFFTWNGTDAAGNPLASGFYFVRISSSKGTIMHRVLITR